MKSFTATISALAFIGAVMAQAPSDLPQCGQTCINNLLGAASDFGCTAGGDGEAACLCADARFTYGIRDCSNESCGDSAAASSVIAYGISYCASAGVAIPTTIATVTSGTFSPTVTSTLSGSDATATGVPITTSSYETTITTDGSTITTSAATTIFSSTATDASATASSISSSVSDALSSISGSVSSALSSASSRASSAASSATETSTSSAFAPQMTAAPVGFLAAAGIAALLL